jgi:hypothetical protein
MLRRRHLLAAIVCAASSAVAACAPDIDLKQAVQVTNESSGWFDAGIQDGKNKLVPSVTFGLRKIGNAQLSSLSLNVVFRFVGEQEHQDDVFVQRVDFSGSQTAPITVRSKWGNTGDAPQSRAEILKLSQFRDVEAQIFAKHGAGQWVELRRVKIERQLLTQ